jgi:hypothetical protein
MRGLLARPLSHFVREWGLASIDQILDGDRARVFGWRVLEQFGWSGVAVLAASLAVMIALAIRTRSRRWLTLCLLGAALTQVAFFYVDRVSDRFNGDAGEDFLPMREAMRALGVSRQTVLQRVKRGELAAVHVMRGKQKGLRIKVIGRQSDLFDPTS